MSELAEHFPALFQAHVVKLGRALGILILGWLVALALAGLLRRVLERIKFSNFVGNLAFGSTRGRPVPAERFVSRLFFYAVMFFVFISFFEALDIAIFNDSLESFANKLLQNDTKIFGLVILIGLGWVLANLLKYVVTGITRQSKVHALFKKTLGEDNRVADTLGNTVYWVVLFLFSLMVLDSLGLQALLAPLQSVIQGVLEFLPNVFGSILLLAFGWFLARVVQRIATNIFLSLGIDNLTERMGLESAIGHARLSEVLGQIAYVFVFLPVLIAAINELQLEAITQPASDMLAKILTALPSLFAAILLLFTAFVVARVLAALVTNVLTGAGFNRVISKLGLGADPHDFKNLLSRLGVGSAPQEGKKTPAELVGAVVLIGVMIFATIEALGLVGFDTVAALLTRFVGFGASVLLGLLVLALGFFFADLIGRALSQAKSVGAYYASLIAKVSIWVLSGAMALEQMGLAQDILKVTFALVVGSVAVAVAIAFGLGGRDIAASLLREFLKSIRSKERTDKQSYDNNPILKP